MLKEPIKSIKFDFDQVDKIIKENPQYKSLLCFDDNLDHNRNDGNVFLNQFFVYNTPKNDKDSFEDFKKFLDFYINTIEKVNSNDKLINIFGDNYNLNKEKEEIIQFYWYVKFARLLIYYDYDYGDKIKNVLDFLSEKGVLIKENNNYKLKYCDEFVITEKMTFTDMKILFKNTDYKTKILNKYLSKIKLLNFSFTFVQSRCKIDNKKYENHMRTVDFNFIINVFFPNDFSHIHTS